MKNRTPRSSRPSRAVESASLPLVITGPGEGFQLGTGESGRSRPYRRARTPGDDAPGRETAEGRAERLSRELRALAVELEEATAKQSDLASRIEHVSAMLAEELDRTVKHRAAVARIPRKPILRLST